MPRIDISKAKISNRIDLAFQVLAKQDAVDAAITILEGSLSQHWEEIVADAVDSLEARVLSLSDETFSGVPDAFRSDEDAGEQDVTQDFVLALLASLELRLSIPPSPAVLEAARELAERLVREGARQMGVVLDMGGRGGIGRLILAPDDLTLMMTTRVALRRQEISQLIRRLLTSRTVRRVPQRLDAWREGLLSLLGVPANAWVPLAVEGWGVRWRSIGLYQGAIQGGATAIRAWNPKDHKTSPFCNWVHGKVISVERAGAQISSYLTAVRNRDELAAVAAWPLRSFTQAEGPDQYAAFLVGVGLPPYHQRCRTEGRPA